ncbi:MAG TPA: trigger factor [Acidimicrobiia bacterium]|nr:trigger factor [Acidimicrobiia bacterium]
MTQVTEAGPFERLVTLTIAEADLEEAKGRAARKLSREMKVKGFRPGKVPRRVVESMVGPETLRQEAIEDVIPELATQAIEDSGLEPVVTPRVSDIRDVEGGVEVDVTVTLWPTLEAVPAAAGRRILVTAAEVGDDEVESQIERMRKQFAELEDVDREGFEGDFVTVDVRAARDGEAIEAVSTTDMLYEIGSGAFLEGMDEALPGTASGGIAEFTTTIPAGMGEHGGEEVTVRVLVKGVKTRRLPDLTDEWVDEMSEFETVEEMRSSLREQLAEYRMRGIRAEFEEKLLDELREDMEIEVPQAIVESEMDSVLHRFAHRLESQGISLEQYFQITGQEQQAFVEDLRNQAKLNVETRILLDSVAESEGLEVTSEEIDEAVTALAAASQADVDEYRKVLQEGSGGQALAGDILRRKATDRLLELAVAVDADGNEIDFPEPPDAEDSDADDEDGPSGSAEDEEE